MRARDLASTQVSVAADAPAAEAASLLGRPEVRAIFVLGQSGYPVGVLTDSMLLRYLLPPYVEEAGALARVLEEEAAEALSGRLAGRLVGDILEDEPAVPFVEGDATLVEVASAMVQAGRPLVAVVEEGRLAGGITLNMLLDRLLRDGSPG